MDCVLFTHSIQEETDFTIYDQIEAEAHEVEDAESDKSASKLSDHYHDYDDEAEDDQGDKSVWAGPHELATGEEDWWMGGRHKKTLTLISDSDLP